MKVPILHPTEEFGIDHSHCCHKQQLGHHFAKVVYEAHPQKPAADPPCKFLSGTFVGIMISANHSGCQGRAPKNHKKHQQTSLGV
jgi:hypothetical protein